MLTQEQIKYLTITMGLTFDEAIPVLLRAALNGIGIKKLDFEINRATQEIREEQAYHDNYIKSKLEGTNTWSW